MIFLKLVSYRNKLKKQPEYYFPKKIPDLIFEDLRKITAVQILGFVLLMVTILLAVLGFDYKQEDFTFDLFIQDFHANIVTELGGIAVTILVVDFFYRKQSLNERRSQLIRELGSTHNVIALRSLSELRAQGWLSDGSLKNAFFEYSDLRDANLSGANLSGSWLYSINLEKSNLHRVNFENVSMLDVNLSNANMAKANLKGLNYSSILSKKINGVDTREVVAKRNNDLLKNALCLSGAIMPDGKIYDGRYNLKGDLHLFKSWNFKRVDINTVDGMAASYGVSVETYQEGQKWYQENIAHEKPQPVDSGSFLQKLFEIFWIIIFVIVTLIKRLIYKTDGKHLEQNSKV